jgi:hypothetical protein
VEDLAGNQQAVVIRSLDDTAPQQIPIAVFGPAK